MSALDAGFSPGDIVSIRFGGVLRHYGLVTTRGSVISNSRAHGGVVEQSFDVFAAGKRVRGHARRSDRHALEIEARARRAIGARYELLGSNCGDFTDWIHRRRPTPTQVIAASAMAVRDMLRRR